MKVDKSIIFGPLPSRRLGRSLGINNIPPKTCSYSCVYCQLGRTIKMQVDRQKFYKPEDITSAMEEKVEETRKNREDIDYLTFVPDGEPTLDANLGKEIKSLEPLGIPIAVITNSSLIWQQEVRSDLMRADWVSLKMDAVEKAVWRQINRPHKELELGSILEGALEFAQAFKGDLMTETMLVQKINDDDQNFRQVADFLSRLQPSAAYIAIPTRPPAEEWAQPPDPETINRTYQIFSEKVEHVEYLTGYEGDAFAFTGNIKEDLLSITAVHPMREDAVEALLKRSGADWSAVRQLVNQDRIIEAEYGEHKFYLRSFKKNHKEKD